MRRRLQRRRHRKQGCQEPLRWHGLAPGRGLEPGPERGLGPGRGPALELGPRPVPGE